jgi:UDP-3-O-[3-hydroxymyristoyl] glucosamine N-acyltransferase
MQHPGFFHRAGPFPLRRIAELTGAALAEGADPETPITSVGTLSEAGPTEITFLDNRRYARQLESTRAGACFVASADAGRVPGHAAALVTASPYRAFAKVLELFYSDARLPKVARGTAAIDPSAVLEEGVVVEPGVTIGPEAHVGRGTRIAAGAVIGYRVHMGRDCFIGPNATITHALIGDRVIIQAGARLGQDGFGYAMGAGGHLKVMQIGRVIVQDDVAIGANSCIDRGALRDTIIGEGTKIDNMVQIGHNVLIGRHCVICALVGIAGSTELADFVVMGGQSGTVGHIKIGAGSQIAGAGHATKPVRPGSRVGGTPARPMRQWAEELAFLSRSIKRNRGSGTDEQE